MSLNPNIVPALAEALEKKGYTSLTEVQESVLAPEAKDADLLVSAQTGSGKTAAFGMAIAPTLLEDAETFEHAGKPLALIVAPTRELALQVQRELVWLYGVARGRIASCVGGMDPRTERRALERGCHIVVGTPGRLCDHIKRRALDLSGLKAIVLDEADEMLDFGFREDLEFILDAAPEERRTLMFSATVPRSIATMAKRYQKDAVRISTVGEQQQHGDIDYRAMAVAPADRENAIINVLRFYDAKSAIVFCGTRMAVNRTAARFGNRGFSVVALSGELSQSERTHALQAMRDGRARVCVATDVAARGIDLPGLELVIHADLPTNSDTLKHRSGRTGRAGQKGTCALIVANSQRGRANRLLRDAKIQAEWCNAPSLDDIKQKDRERLLSDPSLSETYDEDALAFAKELLERHGAEQVAAAFLNRTQSEMPAAEELVNMPAPSGRDDGPKARRDPFTDGVWFEASVGRKQNAEPRWLLPMICKLGGITKKEVGSIKIEQNSSRFEITGKKADRFWESVVAKGGGENNLKVTKASGGPSSSDERSSYNPDRSAPSTGKTNARHQAKKHGEKSYTGKPKSSDDRPSKPKSFDDRPPKPKSFDERPSKPKFDDRPGKPKPAGRPGGKLAGKFAGKPGGKPINKTDGKPGAKRPSPAGSEWTLKRKKRKPKSD